MKVFCVEAACPIHLVDNLSRHSPIMLQLRIPEIQLKTKKENMTYLRTPSWYKASYGKKIYYKNLLAERLGQLNNSEALCCTISHARVCSFAPETKCISFSLLMNRNYPLQSV